MPYHLTAEQLAIQEDRKRKKTEKQTIPDAVRPDNKILLRNWLRKRVPKAESSVKLATWNLLAQTLIRRDLFPSSDCLKGSQRESMIPAEILGYSPDIACLQEVDRIEKLLPPLTQGGYSNSYAAGRGKKHGCMIIWKQTRFHKLREHVVYFDECDLTEDMTIVKDSESDTIIEARRRRGSTRKTKNIALIVALGVNSTVNEIDNSRQGGYVVATCHLFWHPRYIYERVRQGAILVREIAKFKNANGYENWPVFLAGDFNSQPSEALYSLLVGDPLTVEQIESIEVSRVIHVSIDPSIGATSLPTRPSEFTSTSTPGSSAKDDDDEGGAQNTEEGDPDRVFTNSRHIITPADGLLSAAALQELYTHSRVDDQDAARVLGFEPLKWRSAYDVGWTDMILAVSAVDEATGEREGANVFGKRENLSATAALIDSEMELDTAPRKGAQEPMYTSYTHYWRLTLDYIFVNDPLSDLPNAPASSISQPHLAEAQTSARFSETLALNNGAQNTRGEVIALLSTHHAADLEPGLPKKGVCASDHILLAVEMDF